MRTVLAVCLALLTSPAIAADLDAPKPAPGSAISDVLDKRNPVACAVTGLVASTITKAKAQGITLAADGYGASFGGNCDFRVDRLSIGVLGRLNLIDLDEGIGNSARSYALAGRLGYYINPAVMLYGMAGVSFDRLRLDDSNLDTRGTLVGLGAEIALARNLALVVEWDRTLYGRWHDDGIAIKPSADAIRLGLTFRLN